MAAASGLLSGGETGELHQGGRSHLPDPVGPEPAGQGPGGELGTRLLERLGKRRLKLTVAGEKLLAFAQGLLARWEALQDELRQLQGRHQGPLSLAAPFTTLYHLLPETLVAYLRRIPRWS